MGDFVLFVYQIDDGLCNHTRSSVTFRLLDRLSVSWLGRRWKTSTGYEHIIHCWYVKSLWLMWWSVWMSIKWVYGIMNTNPKLLLFNVNNISRNMSGNWIYVYGPFCQLILLAWRSSIKFSETDIKHVLHMSTKLHWTWSTMSKV